MNAVSMDPVSSLVDRSVQKTVLTWVQPFFFENDVDLSEILRVLENAPVRLGHHTLAGAADRHDRQPHLFRKRKGPHVQRVAQLLVSLLQDAGARACSGYELFALDAKPVHHGVR